MDSLKAIAAALDRGEVVLLFPEGRLTRNGQMRPFGRGIERVLQWCQQPVAVVTACTAGMWGSFFSHEGGRILRKWPKGFRRRVRIWFGEPQIFTTAAEVRAAVALRQAELAIHEAPALPPVPRWFVQTACRWQNLFRPACVDLSGESARTLNFSKLLVAAWSLSGWLKRKLKSDPEPVGVWLPTGLGCTLANVSLGFLKRTTVNLNYTAGELAVESAIKQAGIRTIITSKRFTTRVPLAVPDGVTVLNLEDALSNISKFSRSWRFLTILITPTRLIEWLIGVDRLKSDGLLTIVFSSGSTGEPKGVMLTHANIASNVDGFQRGVALTRSDVMLACLPTFHSFGFTVCTWATLCIGMKAVYSPDPRASQEIGERNKKYGCTIFISTATFLRFYLRRCDVADFASLRLIICGAEKLPVKLANEFRDRFGVLPLEGYGCTEVSPVVCVNLHDVRVKQVTQVANRPGTVGQPIPGVVACAFDLTTDAPLPPGTEGMLCIKGPNVMKGYLHQPEKTTDVIRDGWYRTGDLGCVEVDGFIRITGRVSRFAKIAGEMVPLERLEESCFEILGSADRVFAVCAVPDEKRGERLVVLYLAELESKLPELLSQLGQQGFPNLWIPERRDCYALPAFPILGSGKLDLKAVGQLAIRAAARK